MKKYLLGLLVGFVSFIGFSYSARIYFIDSDISGYYKNNFSTYSSNVLYQFYSCSVPASCYYLINEYTGNSYSYSILNSSDLSNFADGTHYFQFLGSSCKGNFNCSNAKSMSISSPQECPTCPDCEVCQECPTCSVYNLSLAPLGGSTENYSITGNVNVVVNEGIDYELDNHNNALWLSVGFNTEIGGQCTGDVIDPGSGNWSALFINGIQHESASLIDINIADYVSWDYSINEDVFDLDVGSGYDQDYIDGVINVQSYRPTSEDFTQTFVGGLILFTPYVVILLFVILVWNLIKKIFKTK